jgi:hypothetical protein
MPVSCLAYGKLEYVVFVYDRSRASQKKPEFCRIFFFLFFLWDWGLNSGLHACKARSLNSGSNTNCSGFPTNSEDRPKLQGQVPSGKNLL